MYLYARSSPVDHQMERATLRQVPYRHCISLAAASFAGDDMASAECVHFLPCHAMHQDSPSHPEVENIDLAKPCASSIKPPSSTCLYTGRHNPGHVLIQSPSHTNDIPLAPPLSSICTHLLRQGDRGQATCRLVRTPPHAFSRANTTKPRCA